MRVPEPDEERPVAWLAVLENTPVFSSDGQEIGGVREVVGSEDEDIFHGIVVSQGLLSRDVMIPAAQVGTITNKRIEINLSAEEVRELPPFVEEQSYELGFVGVFRKRLGWTDEGKGPR